MSTQPEYLNRSGNLNSRVTHAHNDWLQAPVEWGAAGWVVIGGTLTFFATLFWSLIRNPRATSAVLLGALVLFSSHAFLDFLLFIPHLCIIAILVAWIRLPDTDSTSR
jgi:O-antigen ligase